jgi:phosphoglucosamine mutase
LTRKYFGTDGVRGRVGQLPMTPEFALKLGWAAGRVLGAAEGARVVIGKDTRRSGYVFESALEAGLAAAGVAVDLLGPLPTPGVAYLTRALRAQAGVVISASHNPHYDNGVKFFGADGGKLNDALELEIEALLEQPMQCVDPAQFGRAKRIADASGRYIEFCKGTFDEKNLNGLRVVIDCAHGAAYKVGPAVLEELGAEVEVIGDRPNGLNINDGCGPSCGAKGQRAEA